MDLVITTVLSKYTFNTFVVVEKQIFIKILWHFTCKQKAYCLINVNHKSRCNLWLPTLILPKLLQQFSLRNYNFSKFEWRKKEICVNKDYFHTHIMLTCTINDHKALFLNSDCLSFDIDCYLNKLFAQQQTTATPTSAAAAATREGWIKFYNLQ